MTIERTISIDTLILEIYQDENMQEHIRVVRKGLTGELPIIDFKKGSEAEALLFLQGLAKLCGVEITHETKNDKDYIRVDEKSNK